MTWSEDLRHDHEALYATLAQLEALWPELATAPAEIARLTAITAACLRAHFLNQEHAARQPGETPSMSAAALRTLQAQHRHERAQLNALTRLLHADRPLAERIEDGRGILEDLRAHLGEETGWLFPPLHHAPALEPGEQPSAREDPEWRPWSAYREPVRRRLARICVDHRVHPGGCTALRFLPEFVEIASRLGNAPEEGYRQAIKASICAACRGSNRTCPAGSEASCCLLRYLPLLRETIKEAQEEALALAG